MTTKQFNEIFGSVRKYVLRYNRMPSFSLMVEELCIFGRALRVRDDYKTEKRRFENIVRNGFRRISEGPDFSGGLCQDGGLTGALAPVQK